MGAGSIACLSVLFVMFWWTILQSDPEDPQAIRRKIELERWNKLDPEDTLAGRKGSVAVNPMFASQKQELGGRRRRRSTRDLSAVLGIESQPGGKKGWA